MSRVAFFVLGFMLVGGSLLGQSSSRAQQQPANVTSSASKPSASNNDQAIINKIIPGGSRIPPSASQLSGETTVIQGSGDVPRQPGNNNLYIGGYPPTQVPVPQSTSAGGGSLPSNGWRHVWSMVSGAYAYDPSQGKYVYSQTETPVFMADMPNYAAGKASAQASSPSVQGTWLDPKMAATRWSAPSTGSSPSYSQYANASPTQGFAGGFNDGMQAAYGMFGNPGAPSVYGSAPGAYGSTYGGTYGRPYGGTIGKQLSNQIREGLMSGRGVDWGGIGSNLLGNMSSSVMGPVMGSVSNALGGMVDSVVSPITNPIGGAVSGIVGGTVGKVANALGKAIGAPISAITKSVGKIIGSATKSVMAPINTVTGAIDKAVGGATNTGANTIAKPINSASESIGNVVGAPGGAGAGVAKAPGGAGAGVAKAPGGAGGGLAGTTSDIAGGFGGFDYWFLGTGTDAVAVGKLQQIKTAVEQLVEPTKRTDMNVDAMQKVNSAKQQLALALAQLQALQQQGMVAQQDPMRQGDINTVMDALMTPPARVRGNPIGNEVYDNNGTAVFDEGKPLVNHIQDWLQNLLQPLTSLVYTGEAFAGLNADYSGDVIGLTGRPVALDHEAPVVTEAPSLPLRSFSPPPTPTPPPTPQRPRPRPRQSPTPTPTPSSIITSNSTSSNATTSNSTNTGGPSTTTTPAQPAGNSTTTPDEPDVEYVAKDVASIQSATSERLARQFPRWAASLRAVASGQVESVILADGVVARRPTPGDAAYKKMVVRGSAATASAFYCAASLGDGRIYCPSRGLAQKGKLFPAPYNLNDAFSNGAYSAVKKYNASHGTTDNPYFSFAKQIAPVVMKGYGLNGNRISITPEISEKASLEKPLDLFEDNPSQGISFHNPAPSAADVLIARANTHAPGFIPVAAASAKDDVFLAVSLPKRKMESFRAEMFASDDRLSRGKLFGNIAALQLSYTREMLSAATEMRASLSEVAQSMSAENALESLVGMLQTTDNLITVLQSETQSLADSVATSEKDETAELRKRSETAKYYEEWLEQNFADVIKDAYDSGEL